MNTLTAVRLLLLLSFMTGRCKATGPTNTTTRMCRVPFASIQSNLLSQDILYNTVMRTCKPNSMSKWKYSAFTGYPPTEFYDAFSLPANVRLNCALAKVACLLPVNGSLSIMFASTPIKGDVLMCSRGRHVYAAWNSSVVGNMHAYSDTTLMPSFGQAIMTSDVEIELEWPFSLLASSISRHAQSYIATATSNYIDSLCKV